MKSIFLLFFIGSFNFSTAQIVSSYHDVLHSDYLFLNTIEEDKCGNLFIAGTASSPFNLGLNSEISFETGADKDLFVVKYDVNKEYEWHLYLKTNSQVIRTSKIQFDNEGNVYLLGYFTGFIDMTPDGLNRYLAEDGLQEFIAKYSADGQFISMYTFEHNINNNILQFEIKNDQIYIAYSSENSIDIDLSENELIINTYYQDIPDIYRDVYVSYNLDFEILNYFISTYRTHPQKVFFLDNGDFVSGGLVGPQADLGYNESINVSGGSFRSPYIAKYDSDKNLIWYYILNLNEINKLEYFAVSNDRQNTYLIVFIGDDEFNGEQIFRERVILKLNNLGELVASKRISDNIDGNAFIVIDSDENIWVIADDANLIVDHDDELNDYALIVFDRDLQVIDSALMWADYILPSRMIPKVSGGVTIANNGRDGKLYIALDEELSMNGELKITLQDLFVEAETGNVKIHSTIPTSVFPTVSKDVVNFKSRDNRLIENISIQSISGMLVSKYKVKSCYHSMNIEALDVGVYIARITFDSGEFENHKFIKN
ncbi:MAG: hypothetical protein ACJATI_001577 [Halioglobus sp.]|jgi:hypothetical protein